MAQLTRAPPERADGAVRATVGIVVKGYPRLSETFVAQELLGLERAGLSLRICSLRRPRDGAVHPVHREIRAPVHYLPEYLHEAPGRVARAWRALRARPGSRAARRAWLADLARDRTPNRIRRFGQALVLAHELPADVGHLHAHFLHTPASVARYAALIRGLPWSVSAHAKDVWTTPAWEQREKLAAAAWTVTCTRANREHLAALAPSPASVELVYHGLDLARFPAAAPGRAAVDGTDARRPVVFLSVGRLVEKKGYDDLLAALARLPADLAWRFEHVGSGPWRARLARLAGRLGIADRVTWHGALAQGAVIERYAAADAFVLACRVARGGDRDGLPNVLMEAQCMGLACASTRVSAVPELVRDGATGLLAAERDVAGLAAALERLARDPALRARLGDAGRRTVRASFSFEAGVARLAARLGAPADAAAHGTVRAGDAAPALAARPAAT